MNRSKALPAGDRLIKQALGRVRANGSIGKPKGRAKVEDAQKQRQGLEAAAAALAAGNGEMSSSEHARKGPHDQLPAKGTTKPGEFQAKHLSWDEVRNPG